MAVGIGVGVALVSNVQIMSTTEGWTITAVGENGRVEPSAVDWQLVRMVVMVLHREQKCLCTFCIPLIYKKNGMVLLLKNVLCSVDHVQHTPISKLIDYKKKMKKN